MKQLIFVLAITILFSCQTTSVKNDSDTNVANKIQQSEQKELLNDENVIDELLINIKEYILESDNNYLHDIYYVTKDEMAKGNLRIIVIETLQSQNYSKMGNAEFTFRTNIDSSIKPKIFLEKKLLRFYPDNKSLIMGILVHELTHAYFFYNHQNELLNSVDDELEEYLYEMDALFAEAIFYEICQEKGHSMLNFQKLLIDSKK